jgi:phosphoglycolate phosphatase-like HAD superfamily hydrolase
MKEASYETVDPGGVPALLRPGSRDLLRKVDAVVFDCDGTLIDVRESYDATIMKTVEAMVEGFSGVELPIEEVGGKMILEVRSTGGFNSDWETTYALSLLSEVAIERTRREARGREGQVGRIVAALAELVDSFASRNRLAGHRSVDSYLRRGGLESDSVEELRRYLGFPGTARDSRLAATFDQIYYGGELFRKIYGFRPSVWNDEGLIDRETLLISREDLVRFRKIVGGKKMAIATGRSFVAVRHTLGRLLQYFERDASVYIGDGEIDPGVASEMAKYSKPSGASLVRAHEVLSADAMLYVGDSAEDRLMVDDARRRYRSICVAGICGSSFDERAQVSYFTRTDSDLLVNSVSQVPDVLEMIRR